MDNKTIYTFRHFLEQLLVEGKHWDGASNVSVSVQAYDPDQSFVTRKFYVYQNEPAFPDSDVPVIWYIKAQEKFYKSNNWKGQQGWTEVTSYSDLFWEPQSGSGSDNTFNSGNVTVPVILSRVPVDPMEAVPLSYLNQVVSTIQGGGSTVIGPPVQDIAALKALDAVGLPDKHLRFVEDAQIMFSLDTNPPPTWTADDVDHVRSSTVSTAFWVAVDRRELDSGQF